jgi:energy-coupling factor transporter ATP-binding protein EcfA2
MKKSRNQLSKMNQKYATTEVFTPARPAVIAFIEREYLNEQLVDALRTPGKQIIIFGQTGSGKTTLLYNKLKQTYEGAIICRCTQQTTFEQILIDAFDQLDGYYIGEQSSARSKKMGTKIVSDFMLIKNEIGGEVESLESKKMLRVLPPQLTPSRLARFIGTINHCWVIEDVHKIPTEEKIKVSQVMKVFMDLAVDFPELKMILVGAVGTPKEIIKLEKDMRNRTVEISVPLMTDQELTEIINKGETLLQIGLEYSLREAISKFSCGLPSVTHQLCLNLCLNKAIYETCDFYTELNLEDFILALKKYVNEISDGLKDQYDLISESISGTILPFEIIKSIIILNLDYVSKEEITENLSRRNIFYNTDLLDSALDFLISFRSECILNYDLLNSKYSFANPFLKVYLHCHIELENYQTNKQLSIDFKKKTDRKKEMVRLILENGGYKNIEF